MRNNLVILKGHLGKDPETKIHGDMSITVISVATNDSYRNQKGEYVTETEWHRVKAFRKLSGRIQAQFKKGDMIEVIGKNKKNEFTNKEGQKVSYNEVHAIQAFKISTLNDLEQMEATKAAPTEKLESDDFDDLPF